MTAYDRLQSRTNSQALIPEQVSNSILTNLRDQSAAIALSRKVRMSTNQTRMPVLSALPTAYWVDGDTGLKKTSQMAWENKTLNVEELAVIVPFPDVVLADMSFDAWGEVQGSVESEIARAIDSAIFFGTNKPASWPADLVSGATSAGNTITRGTAAGSGGVAEDINLTFGKVEADGYDVNGIVVDRVYRRILRSARDTTGQKLLDVTTNSIEGVSLKYAAAGLWPSGSGAAELLLGDFGQSIVGLRQDITVTRSNQAVIQDNTGAIIYNAFQNDMTLMRVTFRLAWQVANTLTYSNSNASTRYPFAVLKTA